ncbi:positive regulation of epithelial to mesenchymal transition [Mactra antiquata]
MSYRQDSGCFDESKEEDGSSSDACALSPLSRDNILNIDKRDKHLLQKEVEGIKKSLDLLRSNLIVQQSVLARDFEDRIRHVYDDVINDINSIRKCINSIGDTFDHDSKFKTWAPVMPFRKDILPSVYEIKASGKVKLKGSKSVDFVDQKGKESYEPFESDVFSKYQSKTTFCKRRSWLSSSRSSVSSVGSSRKSVAGFGQCFSGDGKTVPYRSYKALALTQRNNRHSWGPSRTGSRSALDDDDDEIDRGCLCGTVTDDWRAKVAPYMSEGSHVPGLETSSVDKLRERYERTSNFTQMIWKSSKVIGVGISKLPFHDTYIIVVQYIPSGNVNTSKKFRQNVPAPISSNERQVSKSEDDLTDTEDVFYTNADVKNVDKTSNVILTSNLKGLYAQNAYSIKPVGVVDKPNEPINTSLLVQSTGVTKISSHLVRPNENESTNTKNVNNEASGIDNISCFDENESESGTTLASVSASIVSSLNDLMKDDELDREHKEEANTS